KPALLYRQSLGADDELRSSPNRDFSIANCKPLEIVVVRCLHVKEVESTVAVKYDLAVACGFDRDRLLRRSVRSEIVRTIKRPRAAGKFVRVFVSIVPLRAGAQQNRVPRLYTRSRGRCPVGARARQVVCAQKSFECGLGFWSLVSVRIDVKNTTTRKRLRLRACTSGCGLRCTAAVGIGQLERALVLGIGLEV